MIPAGEAGAQKFVAFVEGERDDAARHGVVELRQLALLDHAAFGHHHDELVVHELAHRQEGLHLLVLLQVDQARNVLALAGGAGVGKLIDFEPEHPPAVGERQQVAQGGGDQHVLDEIFGARAHADAALAAAGLPPVGVHRGALEVAAAGHRHRHVLVLDQVLDVDLAGLFDDLGAPLIAELLLDFAEFLDDDRAQDSLRAEDPEVLGDAPLDVGQLVQDLLALHAGEALELHLDDGLRLALGEVEARHQALAGLLGIAGGANELDHGVEKIQGFLSRMCSRSRALRNR